MNRLGARYNESMDPAQLRSNLSRAKERLLKAETVLAEALRQVESAPLDKAMIGAALLAAYQEMRAATQEVSELATLITAED